MKKVLIIGGGVAGLSAGIYLAKSGVDCHIFEKQTVAGGNLTGWNRQGHHIDNCVHWLTGTNPKTDYYKSWCEVGALGDGLVYQPTSLFSSEYDGQTIEMSADIEKTCRDMLALSPEDSEETEKFFAAVKTVMLAEGFSAGKGSKRRWWAVRMLSVLRKYHGVSLMQLGARFKHPLLQKLFSDYILGDFSAVALIYTYAHFAGGDAALPVGGSFAMAQRMRKKFEDLGGKLTLGADVTEIVMSGGRADGIGLADGTYHYADYVVCACDPSVTFGKLLKSDMPKHISKQYTGKGSLIYSSMHCAFACAEKLPFDGSLVTDGAGGEFASSRVVLREYAHETAYAPHGGTVLQSMVYLLEKDCREWIEARSAGAAEYRAKKKRMAADMEQRILARFPGLTGKLKLIDTWTPATYNRYFDAYSGAWMTSALTPKASFIPKKSRIPKIKNVFLATQWQQLPGGLPVAMSCGKTAAMCIIKHIGKKNLQTIKVLSPQKQAD